MSVRNKSASIVELISSHKLDIITLTETWHEGSEDISPRRIVPTGYSCIDASRTAKKPDGRIKRGGGLAFFFYKNTFYFYFFYFENSSLNTKSMQIKQKSHHIKKLCSPTGPRRS